MHSQALASLTTWLPSLRCPLTGDELLQANAMLLAAFNRAVSDGQIRNELGDLSDRLLDAALINRRGTFLYPIHCGIPVLLRGEAIAIEQFQKSTAHAHQPATDGANPRTTDQA